MRFREFCLNSYELGLEENIGVDFMIQTQIVISDLTCCLFSGMVRSEHGKVFSDIGCE